MSNPPVVEKTNVDISLMGGIDESKPEEAVEWGQAFTNIENLVSNTGGYHVRPGSQIIATADSDGASLAPIFRAAGLKEGVGFIGNGYQLYQYNEILENVVNKGKMPEFSVSAKKAGGTGPVTTVTGCIGVGITSNYYVIAYQSENQDTTAATISYLHIDIFDKTSNNVVKSYIYESTGLHRYCMVCVDSRYLHVFQSLSGGSTQPRMFVIDTQALPAGPSLSPTFTTFTSSVNGDYVVGAVAITNNSVAVIQGPTTQRIERFGVTGTSAANAAIAGFSVITGIDTDGTNFYVCGRTYSVSSLNPANLNLGLWCRASYGGSPWVGVASAGGSGARNLAEAVNAPAVGAAVNGLTPANFDGVNDILTNATAMSTIASASAGTIILLARVDTNPGGERPLFASVNVAGATTDLYISYRPATSPFNQNIGWTFNFGDGTSNAIYSKKGGIGEWCFIACRWNGFACSMKVNSGDWQYDPAGNMSGGGTPRMGADSGGNFLDCSVLEVMVSPTYLTDSQVEDIKEYMNNRYSLSM